MSVQQARVKRENALWFLRQHDAHVEKPLRDDRRSEFAFGDDLIVHKLVDELPKIVPLCRCTQVFGKGKDLFTRDDFVNPVE